MATQADVATLHHRCGAPPAGANWEEVELETVKPQTTIDISSKDKIHLSTNGDQQEDTGGPVVSENCLRYRVLLIIIMSNNVVLTWINGTRLMLVAKCVHDFFLGGESALSFIT